MPIGAISNAVGNIGGGGGGESPKTDDALASLLATLDTALAKQLETSEKSTDVKTAIDIAKTGKTG